MPLVHTEFQNGRVPYIFQKGVETKYNKNGVKLLNRKV